MKKRKKSIKKPSKRFAPSSKIDGVQIDRSHSTSTESSPKTKQSGGWLRWFDDHILLILSGFLFAFIPLYPKIPLADLIPGYIVRLRLEDFFVGISFLIYLVQVSRKKATWKTPFTWLILAYAVGGILSVVTGVFLIKTIPLQPLHIGKSMLHYFRYLEYFSVFFIAYSALKTKQDIKKALIVFSITVLLISLYGYGQKYFYWPLYSTMNREFSKGQRLYLTENARVQSTFGGHYDMGGYLAIALPVLLALFFSLKKWKYKVPVYIAYFAGLWGMIMSASRASFAGFVVGVALLIVLFAVQQQGIGKKIWWAISRGFVTILIISYMFFTFGESIEERFAQMLQPYPDLLESYHVFLKQRKLLAENVTNMFNNIVRPPKIEPPKNGVAVTAEQQENLQPEPTPAILVGSDENPTTQKPADVDYNPQIDVTISTISADGTASVSVVKKDREYSRTAIIYGLSMAIRLDTLWPQAIQGFQRGPLFGSGYATLTKKSIEQFTEAESTDNNFLRTLGETGLFGFVTFYGLIVVGMFIAGKVLIIPTTTFAKSLAIGFISASIALLVNATYIDVYASSKVAFTYWALNGFVIAYFMKELTELKMKPKLPDTKVETVVLPKPKQ